MEKMRGKKTDTETIYKIMVSMFQTGNANETSKKLNIPVNTVDDVYKRNKDKEEFVKLRKEKMEEFVEQATRIIGKASDLLERRIDTAFYNQDKLDKVLKIISDLNPKDADYKKKQSLANKISELQLNKLPEITTAIGTLYDKRALAKGDSTTNSNITVTMSDELKRFAE